MNNLFQIVDLLGKWDDDEKVHNPTDKSIAFEKLIGYKKPKEDNKTKEN